MDSYRQVEDGETISIDMNDPRIRIECCDCSLTHDMDFAIRTKKDNPKDIVIDITIYRNQRATGANRRWKKIKNQ